MELRSSLLCSLSLLLWCSTAMVCSGGPRNMGGCTSYSAADCVLNGCELSDTSECSNYVPAGSRGYDELRAATPGDEVSNKLRIKRAAGIDVSKQIGTAICRGIEQKKRGGSGPRVFKVICREVPGVPRTITCFFKGNPHDSRRYNQDNDHKRVFYEKLLDAVSADIVPNKRCPDFGEPYDIKKFNPVEFISVAENDT